MFRKKCLHDKGHCLNTAIKYSLLFSWQVNYVKTKPSTWWHITFCFHIGVYVIVLAVRRRLHGKKSLNPRTKYDLSCSSHMFLQTLAYIQSFQFACCCQRLNFMASKHWAANHSWKFLITEECEIPVSLMICRGLLFVPGCHPWLRIKSLTNLMFESVFTEQRRPLPGSLSTLLVE